MKLRELLKSCDHVVYNNISEDMEITGICYDSRQTAPGNLFVAIKGFQTDGNRFVRPAFAAGAAAVLTEEALPEDIPHIRVGHSRRALAELSARWFGEPSKKLTLVGVTGTNGKTTTAYLIRAILSEATGAKVGLIGTNEIITGAETRAASRTTPESYDLQALFREMQASGCGYVVMEVSSHALMLERVHASDFDVGVFTNLTQDHLDFHETMEAYRDAKAKLFDLCRIGVFNLDDETAAFYLAHASCRKRTYAIEQTDADLIAKNIKLKASGVSYEALQKGAIEHISLGIPGRFSVYNSLAAISACLALDLPLEKVARAITGAHGVRGRVEVAYSGDFTVLVDYAHTPDGMENILKTARGFTSGRVITVFGCGGDRDKTKRPLMGKIGTELSDLAFITSDNPRTETPETIIADILNGVDHVQCRPVVLEDRRQAIEGALSEARPGDTVLILGKGHETYQEISGVKYHFDDREEVLRWVGEHIGHAFPVA